MHVTRVAGLATALSNSRQTQTVHSKSLSHPATCQEAAGQLETETLNSLSKPENSNPTGCMNPRNR